MRRFPLTACVLLATAAPSLCQNATTVLLPKRSVWKYLDNGSDQGTAWRAPSFDDSSWRSGPAQLGYGDDDEGTVVSFGPKASNKYITTYFRRELTVANPAAFKKLVLRLQVDDGAVVYLNGTEAWRSNMPAGTIGYRTAAASAVGGANENLFYSKTIATTGLVSGRNVFAVEIHQSSGSSSDISFDLEVIGTDGGPVVVRGPYLQQATPTSIIVRWRTDTRATTEVWHGTSLQSLARTVIDTTPKTEHVAPLTGLQPETRYFYAVGDSAGMRAGNDAEHSFLTPPKAGKAKPTRVWVIGDSGTANHVAAGVRDAYRKFGKGRRTDVWLMLGDNAYSSGRDDEYEQAVFCMYTDLLPQTAVWPTLGNHDAYSASSNNQTGVYYDIFTLPTKGEAGGLASGTEAYYSFDHGNIHFICLDSHDTDRSQSSAMMRWLQADLQNTLATWIIAFWHHPPYTKGSHDSDDIKDSSGRMFDMRQIALPILEQGGVDLVLTGHSHSYERSFLLDGHYGTSDKLAPHMIRDLGDGDVAGDGAYYKTSNNAAHEGAVYVVAGNAGQAGGGSLDHPAMYVSFNEVGSVVLDVDGNRLSASFLDRTGAVRDKFTMLESAPRTLTRDLPRISLSAGGTQKLSVQAGAAYANDIYVIAGSFGTTPGFPFGKLHVPLAFDEWFLFSLSIANSGVYARTIGVLDAAGTATAELRVPKGTSPVLLGRKVYHAGVILDSSLGPVLATNDVRVTFVK